MFETLEQAKEHLREHNIHNIDLKFTDLKGGWRHVSIMEHKFDEDLMTDGLGFDGSSLGLKSVKASDMILIPDLSTGFLDPFWETPTLSFICSIFEAGTKKPYAQDPRQIAHRAEAYLRETGIADESRWGPEYEFYVFDEVGFENEVNRASYRVDSQEADWQSAIGGHGHLVPRHGGYHAIPPADQLFNLRSEITMHLERMGVAIKYHHHEVGGPGQCEIEVPMMSLVRSGDVTQLVKYVTKMTARQHGRSATFMPKPLFGEAGNGMHFHQHLFKQGENVFYDPEGYGNLSATALSYIGGVLMHSPALVALTNPSTNSYRRLVPGYEAPVNTFFSLGNRNAAIRVPKYADQPDTARIEFRLPDFTCNVYLALAGQLLAGVDGILHEIDPTAEGFGPFEADSEVKSSSYTPLPASLRDACEALQQDHNFLLAGDIFEQELIMDWIAYKRQDEYDQVQKRPHPYEMELYFDV
jgi:glutamine synthetase